MDIVPHSTNGVNEDRSAPLRAVVSLLSEGRYECRRCKMSIDGLAGYLFDADGHEVGIVHEKCVLPEERNGEQPEPENETTPAIPRLQMIEREMARFHGRQFFDGPSRCA